MEKVGARVIALDEEPPEPFDLKAVGFPFLELSFLDFDEMEVGPVRGLAHGHDLGLHAVSADRSDVGNLAAGLAIERGEVEGGLALFGDFAYPLPVFEEADALSVEGKGRVIELPFFLEGKKILALTVE